MNGREIFRQTSAKQTNAQTRVRQPNKQMVESAARRSRRRWRTLANGGLLEIKIHFVRVFVLHLYHWVLFPGGSRWGCDDYLVGVSSSDDFWEVFVR